MNDGGQTLALLGRALLSLLVVLGLILGAFVAIRRRRANGGYMAPRQPRTGRRPAAGAVRQPRRQIVVLSRVSTSRTSALCAVQFGDRVLLVGTNDQASSQLLAEMPKAEWDVVDHADEIDAAGAPRPAANRTPVGTIVEALRTATARHA